jgi:hypothetical protein
LVFFVVIFFVVGVAVVDSELVVVTLGVVIGATEFDCVGSVEVVAGTVEPAVEVVVVTGATDTTTNLSLLNTVNPAIGILETLSSFTVAVVAGGVYPDTLTGGVVTGGVLFPLPKEELNCEKKFALGVLFPLVFMFGLLKYKNPKTTTIIIIRTIIKSVKFLFDIKF